MKKILLTSALALAVAVGASAKTADELRIYINPGHGSWTANDRPCTLVGHGAYSRTNTDTLSFFESNTNLWKAFGLLEDLREYGLKFDPSLNQTGERWQIGAARDMSNNIVMSHVKCGPFHEDNGTATQLKGEGKEVPADLDYYNRSLSEISAEVDANNFDMFISIHSNAATEGTNTNYPLYIYRGYDSCEAGSTAGLDNTMMTTSKTMAQKSWPYAFANKYGQWTYYSATNMNIRGDLDFYGTGVTGDNGAYGYLGALRHHTPGYLVEGYFHTYQPARHRAMNFDVCRVEGDAYAHGIADYFGLEKEKTGVIYGCVRDLHEKFKDNAYKPNPTTEDAYKPLNGVKVVLSKDGKEVATYTTDNYYNGAYVFRDLEPGKYTVVASSDEYKANEPIEVEVTAAGLAQPSINLESVNYVPPTIVYENYPDPVTNPAIHAGEEYVFEQSYVDEPIEALADKTVRRAIARNGKLYILAQSKDEKPVPTILVYDTKEKAVLANVSVEGTSGLSYAQRDISDIQLTADGVLVACNQTLNEFSDSQLEAGEERGEVSVYRWENDENGLPTGNPVKMFTSKLSGNMYRAYVGSTMAYSGTLADGKIIMPAESWYESRRIFGNAYTIIDGEMASGTFINSAVHANFAGTKLGDDYLFTTAPDDADSFIVTSSKLAPFKAGFNDLTNISEAGEGAGTPAIGAGYYRFAGHSFMAVADNPAEGKNGGVRLVDLNNLTDAAPVATTNTAIAEADAEATAAAAGEPEVDADAEGNVTAAYMNLYAVRGGKVSRFTTRGATQNVHLRAFAYDLKQEKNDAVYTLSFKVSSDVKDAKIVLTPADGSANVEYPVGALAKGESGSAQVDANDLNKNVNYSWSVAVTNSSIAVPAVGAIEAVDASVSGTLRGGVDHFNDPEADAFGMTVAYAAGNRGINIYDPAGTKTHSLIHKNCAVIGGAKANTSSPMRGAVRGNEILLASWGDTSHGVAAFDVTTPDVEPYSVFEGTMDGNGLITNNGVKVGSGTPGVGYCDGVMYTFDEDLAGNQVVRYDMGTAKTWGVAPSKILGLKSILANTNVHFIATPDGFFASQVRGSGNNTTGCPGFLYADKEGNVLYQSSAIEGMDNCTAGLAISADGKTAAVSEIGKLGIYDLTWNEGKPTFTLKYKFDAPTSDNQVYMTYDYAGNLSFYARTKCSFYNVALPTDDNVVTTPARAAYVITGLGSGVEDIAVDEEGVDADAPVLYYNLNGVQISAENLTPGLYIRVQGNKSSKVVIK